MPSLECYDIETLKNYFSVTFVDIKDTSKIFQYVICPWRNDYLEMLAHLKTVKGLVGFNNTGFDYPVLHPFIDHLELYSNMDGAELVKLIYKRANKVIKEDWKKDFDQYLIDQLDLFRVNHFNNKARFTSLKFLQINMDWPDVREINHSHKATVKQGAEEVNILNYNLNDVLSTIEFYRRCTDKIKLRTSLSKKYGVNMRNYNDGQIGSRLFMKKMAAMTGKSELELSSRRTHRKYIELKDCIIEGGVEFNSDGFREVFEKFMDMTVPVPIPKKDKGVSVYFDGMKYNFGFGGLHAARESGVYHNIVSADVSSYYPNLSIGQRFYPQHLGEYFCDAYEEIYKERSKFKKGTAENLAFKYALNIPFGQSNAEWSPFYDSAYLLKITINGQLLLAQLCEWVTMANAGRIIMANTDGIEVDVYNQERFKKLCGLWEKKHNLKLEFSKYKVLAMRDSNAYIGQKEDGTTKEKGPYLLSENREIHQNQSMKIVQEAVKEFFINGVLVEKTIGNCEDIRMFLIGKRARTGKLEYRKAETTDLEVQQLPKNLRYYISRSGGSIVKVLKDSSKKKKILVGADQMGLFGNMGEKEENKFRYVSLHKGWRMTIFNKWIVKPFEEYGIEKRYYINEATKLINTIINSQTSIK